MSITNSREFTINVGKIAEAEKWLSEGADLWKEITGKDAVIYKEGWGDQYKMLFVTTYESMGETEEVGEKVMADKSCLLYTSPSPRDGLLSRMPSSA